MTDVLPYIPEVIRAHFDEAAYLYSELPAVTLSERPEGAYLQQAKRRLDANLVGLIINQRAAWSFCLTALDGDDAGEFFIAAVLAFKSAELEKIKAVVEVSRKDALLVQAVAAGLAWHPWSHGQFWAEKFCLARQTEIATIGLLCCARHQRPSPKSLPELLAAALTQPGSIVAPLLLALVREHTERSVLPLLQQYPTDTLDEQLLLVLTTRLSLGDEAALPQLKSFVMTDNDWREEAINRAFSKLDQILAKQWLTELKSQPDSGRWLLLAIAAMGESSLLPWVVKQMEVPALARVAGKVFSQLSGLDLAAQGWVVNDASLDQQWLELEGDEDLDWPNVAAIKQAMKL